jgi:hypothetical protein
VSAVFNVRVLTKDNSLVQFGYEKAAQAFFSFAHYASRPDEFQQGSLVRVDPVEGQPDRTKLLAWFQRT